MYKRKKKKTELSSQIPFSYPSALPNGFSLISSRREVKSKTKTNRVHWCVVRSALIGEFQDLPLRLVVNPAPRRPISAFRGFQSSRSLPSGPTFQFLAFPPEEVNSVISGPHFLLTVLLRFIANSHYYFSYRLDVVFDILKCGEISKEPYNRFCYCRINTSDRQDWCFSDAVGQTYSHDKSLNVGNISKTKDRCVLLPYYRRFSTSDRQV